LRNTMIANVLDRCAISIPCHRNGDAPVGLMLVGEHGADHQLYRSVAKRDAVAGPTESVGIAPSEGAGD